MSHAFFEKEKALVSRTSLSLCAYINKNVLKLKKPTFAWVAWYDGLSAVAVCCRGSSGWRGAIQRQHTSAYVSIRQHTWQFDEQAVLKVEESERRQPPNLCGDIFKVLRVHLQVSIRQHTPAYASIRQHTSAYASIPVSAS